MANQQSFIDRTNKLAQTSQASVKAGQQSTTANLVSNQQIFEELSKLNKNLDSVNSKSSKFEQEQKKYQKLYTSKLMTYGPMMGMFAELGLDKKAVEAFESSKKFITGSSKNSLTGITKSFAEKFDESLIGNKTGLINKIKKSSDNAAKQLSDTFTGDKGFISKVNTTLNTSYDRIEDIYKTSTKRLGSIYDKHNDTINEIFTASSKRVNDVLTNTKTGLASTLEHGNTILGAGFQKISNFYDALPLAAMAHSMYMPFKTISTSKKISDQQRLREIGANRGLRAASGIYGIGSAVGALSGLSRVGKAASSFAAGGPAAGWSGYLGGTNFQTPGKFTSLLPGLPGGTIMPAGPSIPSVAQGLTGIPSMNPAIASSLPGLPGGAAIGLAGPLKNVGGLKMTSSLRTQGMQKLIGATGIDPTGLAGMAAMVAPLIAGGIGISVMRGAAFKRYAKKRGREATISPSAQTYESITSQYGRQFELDIRLSQDPKEAAIHKLGYVMSTMVAPTLANFEILDILKEQRGAGTKGGKAGIQQLKEKDEQGLFGKAFNRVESSMIRIMAGFNPFGALLGKGYGTVREEESDYIGLGKGASKAKKAFGISKGGYSLLKTPAASVMNYGQSHEEILQLLLARSLDIHRFAATELITIRSQGFGIKKPSFEIGGGPDSFKDWLMKGFRNLPLIGSIFGLADFGIGAAKSVISAGQSAMTGVKKASQFLYGRELPQDDIPESEQQQFLDNQFKAFDFFANKFPTDFKAIKEKSKLKQHKTSISGNNGLPFIFEDDGTIVLNTDQFGSGAQRTVGANIKEYDTKQKQEKQSKFQDAMITFTRHFDDYKKKALEKFGEMTTKTKEKGGMLGLIKDFFFGSGALSSLIKIGATGGLLYTLWRKFFGDEDSKELSKKKSLLGKSYDLMEDILGKEGAFKTSLGIGAGTFIFGPAIAKGVFSRVFSAAFVSKVLSPFLKYAVTPYGIGIIGALGLAAWGAWEINKQVKGSEWYKEDASYGENLRRGILSWTKGGVDVEEYDLEQQINDTQGRIQKDPIRQQYIRAQRESATNKSAGARLRLARAKEAWEKARPKYNLDNMKRKLAFEKIKVKEHDINYIFNSPAAEAEQLMIIHPKAQQALTNINEELSIIGDDPTQIQRISQLNEWKQLIQAKFPKLPAIQPESKQYGGFINTHGYETALIRAHKGEFVVPKNKVQENWRYYNSINPDKVDDLATRLSQELGPMMQSSNSTPMMVQQQPIIMPMNNEPIPFDLIPDVDPVMKMLITDIFNKTTSQLTTHIKEYALL